jgi:hypothetical protein
MKPAWLIYPSVGARCILCLSTSGEIMKQLVDLVYGKNSMFPPESDPAITGGLLKADLPEPLANHPSGKPCWVAPADPQPWTHLAFRGLSAADQLSRLSRRALCAAARRLMRSGGGGTGG